MELDLLVLDDRSTANERPAATRDVRRVPCTEAGVAVEDKRRLRMVVFDLRLGEQGRVGYCCAPTLPTVRATTPIAKTSAEMDILELNIACFPQVIQL
jgi:hypothetical protein